MIFSKRLNDEKSYYSQIIHHSRKALENKLSDNDKEKATAFLNKYTDKLCKNAVRNLKYLCEILSFLINNINAGIYETLNWILVLVSFDSKFLFKDSLFCLDFVIIRLIS